jgi:hypothetical protein
MTESHDKIPARQRHGAARRVAPGIKTLITAASLAATVGGWGLLAQGAPPPTTAAAHRLNLAPIPTVVPAPGLGLEQTEAAPRAPSLRSVVAPRLVRAPIAITRSSR